MRTNTYDRVGWMAAAAYESYGVRALSTAKMDATLDRCWRIYSGTPDWLDEEQGIRTVNMAKSVCSEAARLATLAVGVKVDGSARAAWLQQQIDRYYFCLRQWVEYSCAWGTVILKPNGQDVDLVTPREVVITATDGGNITGAVFCDRAFDRDRYYTRLEYHRIEDGRYLVSNRCYVSTGPTDKGRTVSIDRTPWALLAEDMEAEGVDRPLFGVLRMPGANNIDTRGPMGMPLIADLTAELRDLDVAYSRNAEEIFDSRRISLLDDRLTTPAGEPIGAPKRVRLPRFVRRVFGNGATEYYQEIDPALNTEARLKGINGLLSQIGFKCGFSNGYFVFNERSGMVTATQVEADDRRTIQLVKDIRDKLESALDGLIYAMDKFADAYGLAPAGAYDVTYDFGDITYNREEDRARWWSYVLQRKVPFWYYLTKFEGLPEAEAKALEASAAVGGPPGAELAEE